MFDDLRYRLRALFDRRAMERELEDELCFHLDQEVEKYVRAGLGRSEAERRARLAFGGMEGVKEEAREARGIALFDVFRQDLRYAWRGLRARPAFTAAVVLTLGLGIGANTAIFGIVDELLFRPPPHLADADRVHRVYMGSLVRGEARTDQAFSYKRYTEVAEATRGFDKVAAVGHRRMAVGSGEDTQEMQVGVVSASLFDLFDASPVLGRFFTATEDATPVGAPVAVLGHGFWESRYGARVDVLGEQVQVGAQLFTVIGVAPPGFVGITEEAAPAMFVPITAYASELQDDYFINHNWSWLEILARRGPEVSLEVANADLTRVLANSWNAQREADGDGLPAAEAAGVHGIAGPVHFGRGPNAGPAVMVVAWVMGVSFIVLLVACANVANLLLARAAGRRREIALRLALGVGRRRLLQQLFTESLLIAVLGTCAGLLAAQWGGRALRALFLTAEDVGATVIDARTLLFAAVVTLGVALLTGLAPVLQALSDDRISPLKAGMEDGAYRRSPFRTALLVLQGALSVTLLIGASLFVRSVENVRAVSLGYDLDPVVYVERNLRGVELSTLETGALADRLVEAAAGSPGVLAATPVTSVPFWSFEGRPLFVPGMDPSLLSQAGPFTLQVGSASYFDVTGTRILRGRGIDEVDRLDGPPVIVVSEAMANEIWPGQDAIGQQIRIGDDTNPLRTVVGIAEDVRAARLSGSPEAWYYLSSDQYGDVPSGMMVRVDGRAEDFIEPIRSRLQREMPGAGYVTAVPLRNLVAPQHRSWELGATMFGIFGGLALLLAAIGLYSVIAYGVEQRRRELGIRMALGARPGAVVRMVVDQGVAFAAAGIGLGVGIALLTGRWVEPLLFAQSPYDPQVIGGVAIMMLVVAVVATLRPAWRATRLDPTVALRAD